MTTSRGVRQGSTRAGPCVPLWPAHKRVRAVRQCAFVFIWASAVSCAAHAGYRWDLGGTEERTGFYGGPEFAVPIEIYDRPSIVLGPGVRYTFASTHPFWLFDGRALHYRWDSDLIPGVLLSAGIELDNGAPALNMGICSASGDALLLTGVCARWSGSQWFGAELYAASAIAAAFLRTGVH